MGDELAEGETAARRREVVTRPFGLSAAASLELLDAGSRVSLALLLLEVAKLGVAAEVFLYGVEGIEIGVLIRGRSGSALGCEGGSHLIHFTLAHLELGAEYVGLAFEEFGLFRVSGSEAGTEVGGFVVSDGAGEGFASAAAFGGVALFLEVPARVAELFFESAELPLGRLYGGAHPVVIGGRGRAGLHVGIGAEFAAEIADGFAPCVPEIVEHDAN